MTKEIIVNAGEMESRVAILENGRLMELHIEREPKIVGNIYRGRVTKVLKGMDAAFIDIGIERNAFLSAADVVPPDGDDEGNGRHNRVIPPITQLLHANQEVLVQVARAPMGTKGARVTTRLSLPGRYMVLMLNSGSYVGVSRKIDDSRERQRLRSIANSIRPDEYSLIVRTEAEGKSDEELQNDLQFLLEMARRIENKADHSPAPSLVHGDLTLIFRLIRDAFTRDVNRLVVDSVSTYENILELVGMIAPRLKNRVFLYDAPTPIYHAYNIEPEVERMLRRKVWLPSGGYLIIDQAEALTAIDVNTGRFVGSVELAETVLTTNLQAADEVARQLRLRDLGGIIVVDFIDMDNPRHRQQVMKAFEDALRRDRAKIKVHSISPLGLVEMTRKRTGESLADLLTEPCPYCSGIGRVQNPLTMALRIERELAATAEEHRDAEAFLVTAHPRVIAGMLGYEGEAQRDLEAYLQRPVYLRAERDFHANTYQLERLTLEQAMMAVRHIEEGEIVEGQVTNPDPDVSMSPLLMVRGMYIVAANLDAPVGAYVKVRVTEAGTSFCMAEPLAQEQGIRGDGRTPLIKRPPLFEPSLLPAYLHEERSLIPPRGLPLQSPTAAANIELSEEVAEETVVSASYVSEPNERRRKRGGRRKRDKMPLVEVPGVTEEEPLAVPVVAEEEMGETIVTVAGAGESGGDAAVGNGRKRRRRRRRGKGTAGVSSANGEEEVGEEGLAPEMPVSISVEVEEPVTVPVTVPAAFEPDEAAIPMKTGRTRRARRRKAEPPVMSEPMAKSPALELPTISLPEVLESLTPEDAVNVMQSMLDAIPTAGLGVESIEEAPKKRSRPRRSKAKAEQVQPVIAERPPDIVATVEIPTTIQIDDGATEAVESGTAEPVDSATVVEEVGEVLPDEAPAVKTRRRRTTGTTRRRSRAGTETPDTEVGEAPPDAPSE